MTLTPAQIEAIAQRLPAIFTPGGEYVLLSVEERDAFVAMARPQVGPETVPVPHAPGCDGKYILTPREDCDAYLVCACGRHWIIGRNERQVAEAEVTRLRQEREGQTAWAVVAQEQSDPNKELIRVYASRELAEASLQPGEHVEEWPYALAAPTREEP